MKIQGRLTLGIGVLFAMILLLGIQSVSYVRQLSRATGTILADNYNSLQYAGDMLRSLNDIGRNDGSHMETGHAGRVELPTPAETGNHLTPYLYGTDKE